MVTYIMVSHGERIINRRVKKLLDLVRQYGRGVLVCSGMNHIATNAISIKSYPNPTGILRIIGLGAIKRVLDKYLFFPSSNIFYTHKAIKRLENLISQDIQMNNRVLFITCVPHHDICLAGLHLKQRFPSLRWVIDWQDLWSYDETYFQRVPSIYRRRLLKMEQEIFKTADINVTTNEFARKILVDKYGVAPQKVVAINHCYFEEDFDSHGGLDQKRACNSNPEVIEIGFLGNIFKPPKVPGQKFIESVRCVRNKGVNVELHIYGDTSLAARRIREEGEEDWLIFHRRVAHKESLRAVSQHHFLMLLLDDSPNSRVIMHQKLPHYLRIGKPILAIVPEDSAVAQIIRETRAGYVVPSEGDWVSGIEKILMDYKTKSYGIERMENIIEGFSWENTERKWRGLINQSFSG